MTAPEPVTLAGRVSCSDFDGLDGVPNCCTSCHDDEIGGYDGLCTMTAGPLDGAELCCALVRWATDKATPEQLAAVLAKTKARLETDT